MEKKAEFYSAPTKGWAGNFLMDVVFINITIIFIIVIIGVCWFILLVFLIDNMERMDRLEMKGL